MMMIQLRGGLVPSVYSFQVGYTDGAVDVTSRLKWQKLCKTSSLCSPTPLPGTDCWYSSRESPTWSVHCSIHTLVISTAECLDNTRLDVKRHPASVYTHTLHLWNSIRGTVGHPIFPERELGASFDVTLHRRIKLAFRTYHRLCN